MKPETNKISVGLALSVLTYLPIWVADQKGLLKEEGIDEVKVLAFKGDADVLQALAGGTIDLSVSSVTGLVESIKAGQKFKAVWAGFNQPNFEWYALAKYKTIADTKGGKYGISKFGALTDFLTRYALRTAGLDPEKDVRFSNSGARRRHSRPWNPVSSMRRILAAPYTYVAAEKGFVKLMSQKDYIAPDWPLHVVFGKEDYTAKHPNTIKAFLRGISRAMEWIKANQEEAAQIAAKQTKFKVEYCRKFLEEYQGYWACGRTCGRKGAEGFLGDRGPGGRCERTVARIQMARQDFSRLAGPMEKVKENRGTTVSLGSGTTASLGREDQKKNMRRIELAKNLSLRLCAL